jgi:hypothetical protein
MTASQTERFITYPTLTLLVVARLLYGPIGLAMIVSASSTAEHATDARRVEIFMMQTSFLGRVMQFYVILTYMYLYFLLPMPSSLGSA